jgi:hypothetical protein
MLSDKKLQWYRSAKALENIDYVLSVDFNGSVDDAARITTKFSLLDGAPVVVHYEFAGSLMSDHSLAWSTARMNNSLNAMAIKDALDEACVLRPHGVLFMSGDTILASTRLGPEKALLQVVQAVLALNAAIWAVCATR